MAVFCKEERHQLRMHSLVRAEVSAEEPAYEFAVNRCVISWEMYVFEASEDLFEILSEFLNLVDLPAPSSPSSTTSIKIKFV